MTVNIPEPGKPPTRESALSQQAAFWNVDVNQTVRTSVARVSLSRPATPYEVTGGLIDRLFKGFGQRLQEGHTPTPNPNLTIHQNGAQLCDQTHSVAQKPIPLESDRLWVELRLFSTYT